MQKTLALILFCSLAAAAQAHPGKTDRYGGHYCLRGCEAWGLTYKEYHLHDKNGNPIRVKKKKTPKNAAPLVSQPAETVPGAAAGRERAAVETAATIPGEFPLTAWWAILLLLLLWLLLRRRQERAGGKKR